MKIVRYIAITLGIILLLISIGIGISIIIFSFMYMKGSWLSFSLGKYILSMIGLSVAGMCIGKLGGQIIFLFIDDDKLYKDANDIHNR